MAGDLIMRYLHLEFPLPLILALIFTAGVAALWRFLPEGKGRRFLCGRPLCIGSTVALAVMTAIEGTWGVRMHASPGFWAVALVMMLNLQWTLMDALKRRAPFGGIAAHAGFFLICSGAFWGAPDFVDCQLVVGEDIETLAWNRQGMAVDLPFSVSLEEFRIDYYEDGVSPKQYTSVLNLDGVIKQTSVNHPCLHKGYLLYQSDYDRDGGHFSVLKAVADPWFPLILAGMLLLAIGALARLKANWRSHYLTIAVALLAILFAALSVARINFGTLVPALRSWWFVPHLVLYMIAYSALAIALVLAVLDLAGVGKGALVPLTGKLFSTASSLLILGMLCGAVWAKAAWGDWWTWDAKECWAGVTWLLTLCGLHLPHRMSGRKMAVLVSIVLSFAAMQTAWYGVEHLPAAQTSLHAYK